MEKLIPKAQTPFAPLQLDYNDISIKKLLNKLKYIKQYAKNKINGYDSGTFIDLSNLNVSRITSDTNNILSILANDFVERNNNGFRKAKDFITTNDTLIGDRKIPLNNFKIFYGIEDKKFKAGNLSNFKHETIVVPNRIRGARKIKYINIPNSLDDILRQIDRNIKIENKELKQYIKNKNYKVSLIDRIKDGLFFFKAPPIYIIKKNEGPEWINTINEINKQIKYFYPYDDNSYVLDEDGNKIKIHKENLNASPKILFADENGNSAFVSNLNNAKNLLQLNDFLSKNPSYPIMIDNGRYSNYLITNPNVDIYSGLLNPDNMFIIGTVNK